MGPFEQLSSDLRDHPDRTANVIQIRCQRGLAYLKQHQQAEAFVAELKAYQHWAPLMPGNAPELWAVLEPQTLVISALAGQPAGKLQLDPQQAQSLWYQASQLLQRLHSLPVSLDQAAEQKAIRQSW